MHQRLVDPRVELVAHLSERRQPEPVDRALERLGDGLEAAVQLVVVASPADVVEHRQQRGQHVGDRGVADDLAVAVDPALVVDVLGLQPLQVSGALGKLLLDARRARR